MQSLYRIESREVSWLPQCSSRWLNIGSKCTKPAPQSQSTDPKTLYRLESWSDVHIQALKNIKYVRDISDEICTVSSKTKIFSKNSFQPMPGLMNGLCWFIRNSMEFHSWEHWHRLHFHCFCSCESGDKSWDCHSYLFEEHRTAARSSAPGPTWLWPRRAPQRPSCFRARAAPPALAPGPGSSCNAMIVRPSARASPARFFPLEVQVATWGRVTGGHVTLINC